MAKQFVITIDADTIRKGWAPNFAPSSSAGIEAPPGYYSNSSAISPFRNGKAGQIAPGETFTALADSGARVNALPLNGVVDSAGLKCVILDNARIVEVEVSGDTVNAHNATAHSGHASLSGEDILAYKNATDEYVLYSFNDATDADCGRRTKSSGAYVDTFLSGLGTQVNGTSLTKAVPHKMVIGPDGIIYITNGQYIAAHAPNSTQIDYQALNLGFGFIATALEVRSGYLVIIGYSATTYITSYSRGKSLAWFWDCFSDSYNFAIPLDDNYASAIIMNGPDMLVFTSGRDNTTKIKRFTGTSFQTIFQSQQIGNPPRHGSVDVYQGMVHYAPNGGIALNAIDGSAFHQRTTITVDGETSPADIGMVKNLASNFLYVGRNKGGGTYDIVKIDQTGYAINSDFRTLAVGTPHNSKLTHAIVYFSQFGSGASVWLSLFKNYASIALGGAADLLNKTLTYAAYGAISSTRVDITGADKVDSVYMNMRFNHVLSTATAAIIRKVEIYGEAED